MKTGRPKKAPIYVTASGIEVVSEYRKGSRIYCRIRPHPFFSGVEVARSRVVMCSRLGIALARSEHVHHRNENSADDRPNNLEAMSAADHNRHHKLGTKHTTDARKRIGASLAKAYAEGRRKRIDPAICTANLAQWMADVRSGKADWPTRKRERNASLLEMHRQTRSLKKTADAFGISPSSAWEIIKKYNPAQLRKYRAKQGFEQ